MSRNLSVGLVTALLAVLFWVVAVRGDSPPIYDRSGWPHWRTVEIDGLRCSVRVHVLRREAMRTMMSRNPDVDTDGGDPCKIVGGLWLSRYTGRPMTDPSGIQIDHVIALSEAHRRGGWRWSRDRRADYANDLTYRWHLIPVEGRVNAAKGSLGADAWSPDDKSFLCQWGESRAVIAVLWNLDVPEAERAAIRRAITNC